MCDFRVHFPSFLQYLSDIDWHLGCVEIETAVVGRPNRTAQTHQTGRGSLCEQIIY